MSSYIGKVQIGASDQEQILIGSTLYGTCNTAAAIADKVVTLPDFNTKMNGITVHVKFVNGNSATENVTLAVGSVLAVPITGNCVCQANEIIAFTYEQISENGTAHEYWRSERGVKIETTNNIITKIDGQDVNAATKEYVDSMVNDLLGSTDAMVFKGTIGANGTINTTANPPQTLPKAGYQAGWTYRVITAGIYVGQPCEIGDLIIAINDGPETAGSDIINADWTVAQGNLDGTVIGPASSTATHIARFKDNTGKEIEDSGYTIGTSVPSGAVFTDTTYSLTDGEAYTEYTLIDSSNSPIANSVDSNGASILASVNQGVLTLAAGIQFTIGNVGASLTSPAT